jgi:hypothetical protein
MATAAVSLALATSALAAAPANDDFANAQSITGPLPQTVSGTLAESTMETGSGEPNHTGTGFVPATASVWYSWTSPASSTKVKLSVCPPIVSGNTAGVAVYTGSALNALTLVATGGTNNCSVKVTAPPSTDYKIAVYKGFPAPDAFQLSIRALNAPANDDFVNAQTITGVLPQTVTGTTVDATTEPGESNALSSVWYRWTPAVGMPVRINACSESGHLPAVSVYTGSAVNSLTTVASFQSCRAYFTAIGGTTYMIAADVSSITPQGPDEGPFSLLLRQANPPPNDDLANAQEITGAIKDIAGTTFDATKEPGEPSHLGGVPVPPNNGPPVSVWYVWTSGPSGGDVSIDACNGPVEDNVVVYTGNTYADPLVPVTTSNLSCSQSFNAVPSTTYRIVVQGFADGGPFVLNPSPPPPGGGDQNPGPGNPAPTPSSAPGPTGQRAAALKKCKKKHGHARKACVKRAKRLPV